MTCTAVKWRQKICVNIFYIVFLMLSQFLQRNKAHSTRANLLCLLVRETPGVSKAAISKVDLPNCTQIVL